jgi:hypothetical protein
MRLVCVYGCVGGCTYGCACSCTLENRIEEMRFDRRKDGTIST